MIKYISFDMHGTLTDTGFSDEFWQELLPKLIALKRGLGITAAKGWLRKFFKEHGKYDYRYYSVKHWMRELGLKFSEVKGLIAAAPMFFPEWESFLQGLPFRKIIISSATEEFFCEELGAKFLLFERVFSSLEDFGIAGKPPALYKRVAESLGVLPEEILHVGDSLEMDVENAREAGALAFHLDPLKSRLEQIDQLKAMLKKNGGH